MNKVKLIVLDIDGTIMDKEYRISDAVKNAIKKAVELGVKVVLATGRMHSATVPIAKEIGINTPLLTYQGAMIKKFNPSDEVLFHQTIDPKLSSKLINDLRQNNVQINVYVDDELYVEDESAVLREYAVKRDIKYHVIDSFDEIIHRAPTKIIVIDSEEKIDEINEVFGERYKNSLYVTKSTPIYCEFTNKEVNKGKAVLFLAQKWDIIPSEIMTIGDQDNDKEMLRVAGIGVAMGNAAEGLKKTADYVTQTVEQDGVAKAIEKFVLG